ncbi:hypothetical protein KL932_004837 [Ogataea haglerorum]|nr:hypothetical protein KL932_004837 [Ogataea haglerorum]
MNIIGYYLAIYDAISLSEHFFYLKGFSGYNLDIYNNKKLLNPGYAGAFAFCCGAAGTAIGMDQTCMPPEDLAADGKTGQTPYNQEMNVINTDNYGALYRLVDDLAEVLNENAKLKQDIWAQTDQISASLNANYQGLIPAEDESRFKYRNLKPIDDTQLYAPSPKTRRIQELRLENQQLADLLTNRKRYNQELRDAVDDSEEDLLKILQVLSQKCVEMNKQQLEDQKRYSEQILIKKQQMHAKFLQLADMDEKFKQLHSLFHQLRSYLDENVDLQIAPRS